MTLEQVDENKTDGCQVCLSVETLMTPPTNVIAENEVDIILAYRCVNGHEWQTGWAKGVAYAR